MGTHRQPWDSSETLSLRGGGLRLSAPRGSTPQPRINQAWWSPAVIPAFGKRGQGDSSTGDHPWLHRIQSQPGLWGILSQTREGAPCGALLCLLSAVKFFSAVKNRISAA